MLTKKTDVASELRYELTTANFDRVIDKFSSIDRSCREILTHCQKPSSRNAVTDIAQNLQDTLEQIRLSSLELSIKDKRQ